MSDPTPNELTYGPIADTYANKYGIPKDVFRSTINKISGFNPMENTGDGSFGIAGIKLADNNKSFDPFDVGSSLNVLAISMSNMNQKVNDWSQVSDSFMSGVTGDHAGDVPTPQSADSGVHKDSTADKPFWQYGIDDIVAFFKGSIWTILFFVIGLVFIVGSIYVTISKSGDK